MKRLVFLICLFYCFFSRLQIYEAIAAIFWQSASYILIVVSFMGIWHALDHDKSEWLPMDVLMKLLNDFSW